MSPSDFLTVTERGGEPVSAAQVERFFQRYLWAGKFCAGKDVLEMACGTGPGLGYLQQVSGSLVAGDIAESVIALARQHYGKRVDLRQFDATDTGMADQSLDVIILFEAISNVLQHARATRATISISRRPAAVRLTVRDNGLGFGEHADSAGTGVGLANLRERLDDAFRLVAEYGDGVIKAVATL